LKKAAGRGVRVRILIEKGMSEVYSELPDMLAGLKNVEVRRYDISGLTGGILHAKCIIVDDDRAFIGSQNFDWRAMNQILEAGALVRDREVVRDLDRIFESDWALAGSKGDRMPASRPPTEAEKKAARARRFYVVASPPALNPPGTLPAEDELVRLLDAATKTIEFQLLHYSPKAGREYFAPIDNALRRAQTRGVQVRMIVSDWNLEPSDLPFLKSLQILKNVEVRIARIPVHSGGFVPYSRVIHSKLLAVDGRVGWVGTSNWAKDYFHHSRGVELVVQDESVAGQIRALFRALWESPYVETLDPAKEYEKPRIR